MCSTRRKPDLNRELLDIMLAIACALVLVGFGLGWLFEKLIHHHRGTL